MIPKIIHQTAPKNKSRWDPSWFAYQQSWKDKFPDAEYKLWHDDDLEKLIKTKYDWFYDTYKSYNENIKRIDAARYFLLNEYGGIYADMDFECVNNFWEQLDQDKICIAESGGIAISRIENALIASPQNHDFWNYLFSKLSDHKDEHVFSATGPIFLQKYIEEFDKINIKNCIQYLDRNKYSIKNNEFAIHHQTGVWTRPQLTMDDTVIYNDNMVDYIVSVDTHPWRDAFIVNVFNSHVVVTRKDAACGWGQELKLRVEYVKSGSVKILDVGSSDSRIKIINVNLNYYCKNKKLDKKIDLRNTTLFCYDGLLNTNKDHYTKILSYMTSWIDFGKIKLFVVDPFYFSGVEFHKINPCNIIEYSNFLVSQLNNHIDTEFCIVFQSDGFALNYDSWEQDFLNYDYIGAPWTHHNNAIGNGGFSLRSKKFLEISSSLSEPNCHPEDYYLLMTKKQELINKDIKIAPLNIATKFSIENPIDINHSVYTSFGFHSKSLLPKAMDIIDSIK